MPDDNKERRLRRRMRYTAYASLRRLHIAFRGDNRAAACVPDIVSGKTLQIRVANFEQETKRWN